MTAGVVARLRECEQQIDNLARDVGFDV